jgi:hypothetical protein
MASTFKALAKNADFSGQPSPSKVADESDEKRLRDSPPTDEDQTRLRIGGLVYSISVVLPESRDQAVYDALFKSLREHLLD